MYFETRCRKSAFLLPLMSPFSFLNLCLEESEKNPAYLDQITIRLVQYVYLFKPVCVRLRILKNENVFHWSCLISTIFVLGSSGSNLNMTFHNNLTLFVTRPNPTVTTTKTVPIETPDHDATLKL